MEAFENLDVWKRSARLSADIYRALQSCKDWGFRDQLVRSALSVPSNVAEGYERNSRNEYVWFLTIAKGSCGELRTQLYIAMDVEPIERSVAKRFVTEAAELSKMLQGMISTLSVH